MNLPASIDRNFKIAAPIAGPPRPPSGTIHQLQYLRALAAFGVVVCHASYYVDNSRHMPILWEMFSRAGLFGVILFFVISGYLMAKLATGATAFRFLAHRLIRIYPIYLLCVIAVLLVHYGRGVWFWPGWSSVLLIPGTKAYVLGIEWTLPFELTFYLIVFLLIAARLQRYIVPIAAGWAALIVALLVLAPGLQQGPFPSLAYLPLSQYSAAFAVGMLVPFTVHRGWVGPATPLIGLGLFAASEIVPGYSLAFVILGSFALVAAAVKPREEEVSSGPNQSLVSLGDWSYALYLIHVPVIRALCEVAPASVSTMQLWFAAMGLPIVVAVGVGKVDVFMYEKLKSWVNRSGGRVSVSLGVVFLASFLGVSAFWYAKAFQAHALSAASAPLANRILAAKGGGTLAQAATAAGLKQDGSLIGYIDRAVQESVGVLNVVGWAADSTGHSRPLQALIFRCGQYLGVAPLRYSRPQVNTIVGIGGTTNHGFDVAFNAKPCVEAVEILMLADEKAFATMSAAVGSAFQ